MNYQPCGVTVRAFKVDDKQRKGGSTDSAFGNVRFICRKGAVANTIALKKMEERSTDLVTSIASEASQCTLNRASGRVNVRLERRGLVVRHVR